MLAPVGSYVGAGWLGDPQPVTRRWLRSARASREIRG
jgi:hypothetical protein